MVRRVPKKDSLWDQECGECSQRDAVGRAEGQPGGEWDGGDPIPLQKTSQGLTGSSGKHNHRKQYQLGQARGPNGVPQQQMSERLDSEFGEWAGRGTSTWRGALSSGRTQPPKWFLNVDQEENQHRLCEGGSCHLQGHRGPFRQQDHTDCLLPP